MSVRVFFAQFEPAIRTRFARAISDVGDAAKHLELELHERPIKVHQRVAEFCVIPPRGPVRITWAGIASLWACSQGAARIGRRMFDAKRQGLARIDFAADPELQAGFNLFELSRRLCIKDFPPRDPPQWVYWAPRPELEPTTEDSKAGNGWFFGALSWIMRHEIAHVTLQHIVNIDSIATENEADRQATKWLRRNSQADPNRKPGERPESSEIELEQCALVIGIALVWVAISESIGSKTGSTHPPSAQRIFRCLRELQLREDSLAAEILSDVLQAWIDPQGQGQWAPRGYSDAADALNEALHRLYSSFQ